MLDKTYKLLILLAQDKSPVVEAVEGGGGAGGGEHQVHGAARSSGPAAVTSQTWTRTRLRIVGGYNLLMFHPARLNLSKMLCKMFALKLFCSN